MSVVKVSSWIFASEASNTWKCPECEAEWQLGEDETPETMEMNYCYKCGKKLIEDVTLKACPFCGEEPDLVVSTDDTTYRIECSGCSIQTPMDASIKNGVTIWNKRKSILKNE